MMTSNASATLSQVFLIGSLITINIPSTIWRLRLIDNGGGMRSNIKKPLIAERL